MPFPLPSLKPALAAIPVPSFYEPPPPPAPIPLLTTETDLSGLSDTLCPLVHQDVDMSKVTRRVRLATPPRVRAPSAPTRRRDTSGQHSSTDDSSGGEDDSPSGDTSSGSDNEFKSDSELGDEIDDMKIPKPPGEAGRPGRGGYTLERTLNWTPARMTLFKKIVTKLIDDHLDATRSIAGQSLRKMRLVREEAMKRLPELERYEQEWPVTDAIKLRLKYTSSKARKHAQESVSTSSGRKRSRKHRQ